MTTMTAMQCGVCGAETRDVYLCPTCAKTLEADLYDVNRAEWDLEVSYTRQDVRSVGRDSGHQKAKYTPLPYNELAGNLIAGIRRLVTSVRDVTGVNMATTQPAEVARRLASHPEGPHIAAEVTRLIRSVNAVIDKRPTPWLYGQCTTCGTDMWDRVDAPRVVCPRCNSSYDGPELKASQAARLQTLLVTRPDAATLMAVRCSVERDKVRKAVDKWVERGRLEVLAGERVRFGDVERLWIERRPRVKEAA
jgi:ribosomal protein L37AE/L43A